MFACPKPVHRVELQYCNEDELARTDFSHTVLVFVPENDEVPIVADATYAQYSFDNGIDTIIEYCATKVRRCDKEMARIAPFGWNFEDYVAYKGEVWEEGLAAAIICTTGNVMARELEAVGGIRTLLCASAEAFQEARDGIIAVMKGEMEALRHQLECITYDRREGFRRRMKDLVENCNGAGHRACMQSYQLSFRPLVLSFMKA